MKVSAIIPAAGSGERFGEEKQFKFLSGRPLFFHALKLFLKSDHVDEIILVVPSANVDSTHRDALSIAAGKPVKVVSGGRRRQDSVKNGVDVSDSDSTLICIHDAVRPFVTEDLIHQSILGCEFFDGVVVGTPIKDTVKISENGMVKETLEREKIWLAQTPQCFHKNKLIQAFDNAETENLTGTDESALMEAMGFSIKLVDGDTSNFKITTKNDWIRAEIAVMQQGKGTVL